LEDRLEQIGVVVAALACETDAMRSRPMPVSIDGAGRARTSLGFWSNCMNTRFQIST
jgi:hypothetical protein